MNLQTAIWLNPPPCHGYDTDGFWFETGQETDFWRHTHYGFVHDTGHALLSEVPADFTAVATFSADYREQFDQAGVMLRLNSENWIKAGLEFADGVFNFGAVVTRGRSDWSTMPVPDPGNRQTIRFTRRANVVAIEVQLVGGWRLLRLAEFPAGAATFGPMACTPTRAGLRAHFHALTVGPAQNVVHTGSTQRAGT